MYFAMYNNNIYYIVIAFLYPTKYNCDNLFFTVFPDEGEPAPNIEEYSSISNYDDYDTDTNSSTAYE